VPVGTTRPRLSVKIGAFVKETRPRWSSLNRASNNRSSASRTNTTDHGVFAVLLALHRWGRQQSWSAGLRAAVGLDDAPRGNTCRCRDNRLRIDSRFRRFIPFAALSFWLYGIAPDAPLRHWHDRPAHGLWRLVRVLPRRHTLGLALRGHNADGKGDLILGIVALPLVGWIATWCRRRSIRAAASPSPRKAPGNSLIAALRAAPDWFGASQSQMTCWVVAGAGGAFGGGELTSPGRTSNPDIGRPDRRRSCRPSSVALNSR